MIDIYKEIVPQLKRTWVYNGDTDPCVSYEGTRLAVKQIQFDELDGGSYRPWFYNQTGASIEVLAEKSALFGP
jgi:cathepsin A (carboxypeptidase C)